MLTGIPRAGHVDSPPLPKRRPGRAHHTVEADLARCRERLVALSSISDSRVAFEAVAVLAGVIDSRDGTPAGHSTRVAWLARLLAQALGYAEADVRALAWAGVLHDVGKIGVPAAILAKPGRLTPAEFEAVKEHPRLGYEILLPIPRFAPLLDAVLYHHENVDGSGYPSGLRGAQIPEAALIMRVVDTFDAVTSPRPYRRAMSVEAALRLLERDAGRMTDPAITTAFVRSFRSFVRRSTGDFERRFSHVPADASERALVGATQGRPS